MNKTFTLRRDTTILNSDYDANERFIGVTKNVGRDPVLEVFKKKKENSLITSRILFDIDWDYINSFVSSSNINVDDVALKFWVTEASLLGNNLELEIFPLSQSWVNGFGTHSFPIPNSVNWLHRYGTTEWNSAGGDYITSVSSSVSLNNTTRLNSSIKFPFKTLYDAWLTDPNIGNNGYVLKLKNDISAGFDNEEYFVDKLQFYSSDSNTVLKPNIEINWNYINSYEPDLANTILIDDNEELVVFSRGFKAQYNITEISDFKFGVRPKYLNKSFTSGSLLSNKYRLNENVSLYYRILDAQRKYTVIDFSPYTKLKYDTDTYKSIFYLENLYEQQYFTVDIKVKFPGGSERIYSDIIHFYIM